MVRRSENEPSFVFGFSPKVAFLHGRLEVSEEYRLVLDAPLLGAFLSGLAV